MNIKQISLILISLGVLIFILAFLGEIISYIFQSGMLTLAFMAVLIGVILLGYSLYQERKKIDSNI